jgi:bifunctional non-homologous end joining protein LigD
MRVVGHEPYSGLIRLIEQPPITAAMLSRTRPAAPAGFIEPCLPSPADRPPSGPGWVHEIKLDGFRMMVRRDAAGVRLLTRNGIDWTARYPLIAASAGALRARSFLLDGEAVARDGDGMPVLELLRYRRQDGRVFLYDFDLIEIEGMDLRSSPLEVRKSALTRLLRSASPGLQLNDHIDLPGESSSGTPASSASRASSASAWARATAQGGRTTGSR